MRLSNLLALPLLAAMSACGKQPVEPRSPEPAAVAPPAIDVVVGDPVSPPVVLPVVVETAVEAELLPKAWTAPSIPGLTFADALRKAGRAASTRPASARCPSPGAPIPRW